MTSSCPQALALPLCGPCLQLRDYARVLEGTACNGVPLIPLAHPPAPEQPWFCFSAIQPVPDEGLDRHSLSMGKQGAERRPECFLVSRFEGIQLCLNVCCLHCTTMCKNEVQVSHTSFMQQNLFTGILQLPTITDVYNM